EQYRPYGCPPIRIAIRPTITIRTDSARCSSWKCRHRERWGLAPDCVLSNTVSPYCFDLASGEVRSAPARKTPEIPDRMERTPGISTPVMTGAVLASCVAPLAAPVIAVCSGVGGDTAPEVPGGGLFGAVPGATGVEPGAVDEFGGAVPEDVDGGILLGGADEFPAPDAPELPGAPEAPEPEDDPVDAPGCGAPPCALGSALRMIGSPSRPEPMTTTFEFGDCASSSVASMPRQRRYDSEMPWLTVF